MGLMDLLRRLFGIRPEYAVPSRAMSRGSGPDAGMDVVELSRRLGVDQPMLTSHVPAYREFTVAKRSGGPRKICAPAPATRELQRTINRRLLRGLSAHPCATGFERGHSIVTNASVHVGKAVVLKMDVKDFFNSTDAGRVCNYFRAIGWNHETAEMLTKLCTHDGSLPQGAPTSPRLSNLVNHALDARLAGVAKSPYVAQQNPKTLERISRPPVPSLSVAYTRYADDITFSLSADDHHVVQSLIFLTKMILADYGYKLHQNRKLVIRRQHQSQRVTGLVVNHRIQLPRHTRRMLRAAEHHLVNGRPATLDEAQLAGWRAVQHMIDTQAPDTERT